jgi:hypothetical protein
MSRPVCPALERTQSGFLCAYSQKPVNPFQWYCLTDYIECPIYVQYVKSRGAVKPEAKPTQTIQPLQTQTTVPVRVEQRVSEPEDELLSAVEAILGRFEEGVKSLGDKWRDYEGSVQETRRNWEREKMKLRQYLMVLQDMVTKYNEELREVELRRSMGLLDEDTFNQLRESLSRRLSGISERIKTLSARFQGVDSEVGQHFRRVVSTSVTPEVSKLRLSLTKLEEMYREGKVSREVYEKLKAELERVIA